MVRENLQTLYAALEEQGTQLPTFVRKELDGYVACGLLSRGFRLLRCDDCRESQLVAFACAGRGFCPSCLGRRMAQTAANLVEHVLPTAVPLRQWVLTFPFSLRSRLAYDGELLGAVGHLFTDSVLGFYRRRMALDGFTRGRSGAMNVVQRTSSDLKLAPHFHTLALDGLYTAGRDDGELGFHALPRLRTDEVADVLQTARIRITNLLERRGLIEERGDEQTQLALRCDDAESEPALARLAQTAVGTQPPAGPELRRRLAQAALPGRPGFTVAGALCVAEQGFSLHAATHVGAHDDRARARLVRYVLRPALASERLSLLPNELVRLDLKKPFADGTVAIEMDPLSLLWRLCASVPPPRRHRRLLRRALVAREVALAHRACACARSRAGAGAAVHGARARHDNGECPGGCRGILATALPQAIACRVARAKLRHRRRALRPLRRQPQTPSGRAGPREHPSHPASSRRADRAAAAVTRARPALLEEHRAAPQRRRAGRAVRPTARPLRHVARRQATTRPAPSPS